MKKINKFILVKQNLKQDKQFYLNNSGILVNRFCLLNILGSGGQARVQQAFDLKTRKMCAVKIMLDYSEEYKSMLNTEVTAIRKINHPHVIKVVGTGHGDVIDVQTKDVKE